ncbi:hypothetical protein BJ986_000129 [Phycicoccus badiiscoriae]|uniref:mitogen-activated protein kinase kinase n=1 Tax=Pedococcus badiiscoriae TaxID=642776 RepID=A0A852WK10_9MICO|nr:serine/threonine-protein kinase [Pedococcus badiiscoriae]NYG05642.1 hypothetical protein [Pedococcus badiiscoriae]
MSTENAATRPQVPGYLLGEQLGRGGSGTVWAATREVDGAAVAVKVVPVGTPGQADQLVREFAVLARVEVDGLVGFHEAVGLAGEPAAVALVLDHVRGGSLEAVVRARGHLSVGESVTMLAPVARALAELHAVGVVHGDVTPANVLLERTGRPLLADLGVASLVGEVPGHLYGTEGFVAPEVLDRGVLTPASDVYAVGALAWCCVTGSAPAPMALRRPLEELAPGLPSAWSELTLRALRADPVGRPTAAELALAYYDSAPCEPLRLVVGTDETSLVTQRLRQTPPAASPDARASARREGVRRVGAGRVGPRRRLLALGTLVLLTVGLGLAVLMVSGRVARPPWLHPNTVGASAATHQGAVPDLAADPAAPRTDPVGLMTALAALRAEVMSSRSTAALARLDAPGSDALARDTALLHALDASGQSWQGVALTVTSARTLGHTATTASVAAVVGTAAYRVVDAAGRAQARPAVVGEELRYELRWSSGRWRVAGISGPTL